VPVVASSIRAHTFTQLFQSLTTTFPSTDGPFPTVDYTSAFHNRSDKQRVFYTLGFDPEGDHHVGKITNVNPVDELSSNTALQKLSSVFRKEHPCDECGRSFVDIQGLEKHREVLHMLDKPLVQHVK
jgi:hypothetical protein